ncbi:MAG: FecR domain-containing protein, partial [Dehalococcoidia bacterium]|nr:FecR domain-containing protein [Dehalococcoidia bacterium]
MRKKLLLILALTILVASTVVGCGEGSPCPSTLTILSITEGEVLVMKEGADDWGPAEQEMELEIGDKVKTGGNSSAEITFFDGSTMELEAGTEIEILSLDIACDTGVTTITLEQMIGTTISRVTAILDPASSYEVETPSGVVGVRGSGVKIQVLRDNWNYEDGTTLVTNLEGNIYVIAQGVELPVPEGERCIMIPGQPPNLMPVAK